MNKLKGIVHDFIHVFCISCFCFSYLCMRAPTSIKALEKPNFVAQSALNIVYKYLINNYPEFNIDNYKQFAVSYNTKLSATTPTTYFISVYFIPNYVKANYTSSSSGGHEYTYYTFYTDKTINIYSVEVSYDFDTGEIEHGTASLKNYIMLYDTQKANSAFDYYLYGSFNLHDDTRFDNTVEEPLSTGYCTFNWFQDYQTVDELLQAIAINPANQSLNPYVIVSSSVQGSSSCEEKGTKNLYNTGTFRIVNGYPEFMYTKPPCKDEQIPTADNVFYYGTEVPEVGQEQYHAVCTYDNKTVYEYKEGSSGGGLVPDEPDYGIFQPLVDLLNSIFAPITALLNLFFGNFSTSLETLFESLFVPTDTYFSNKWDGFYAKFNQKFPFISNIKPLVDSFTAMATNSSTARPDFTITLPEFVGGQTVQIVDLTWFDEYRSMVHAGILFFIYTTFILRLPRKTASAIGGTTS